MSFDNLENRGFPSNPIDKPGYRLEFNDDFSDGILDTRKWLPFYLPQWSNRELAAARYALTGNTLRLFIEGDQPAWCPEHDGAVRVSSLQTGCYSGPLGSSIGQHRFKPNLTVAEAQPSLRLYTPQYGYFETRLKAVPIPGYMVALWMIGFEERPEQCAEICICEIFGSQVIAGTSIVGYGIHPFRDPAISDAFYRDSIEIEAADFHVYAAEWTPTQVAFFLDNAHLRTIPQSPSYPMQFMLGIYELPDQMKTNAPQGPWPKVMEVDYVRGYQPLAGYDIHRQGEAGYG
ncbi:MAG: glycoside hydrolase family 16 protein [Anaerolineales bacterium]|jgi:hypothetical protein